MPFDVRKANALYERFMSRDYDNKKAGVKELRDALSRVAEDRGALLAEVEQLRKAVKKYCDINEHKLDGDIDTAYDYMSKAAGRGEDRQ